MIRLARMLLYDDDEARDVVSEVFATLLKTDIVPKNIDSYLMTSVRNRCLNLLEHRDVRAKFEKAYTLEISQMRVEGDDVFSSASAEQVWGNEERPSARPVPEVQMVVCLSWGVSEEPVCVLW